jgi:hypothetical protein
VIGIFQVEHSFGLIFFGIIDEILWSGTSQVGRFFVIIVDENIDILWSGTLQVGHIFGLTVKITCKQRVQNLCPH